MFTQLFTSPPHTVHCKFNCARDSKSNSSEETIYKSLTSSFLFLIADYTLEFLNAALLVTSGLAQDKVKKPPSCKLTTYIICGPKFDSLITISSLQQAMWGLLALKWWKRRTLLMALAVCWIPALSNIKSRLYFLQLAKTWMATQTGVTNWPKKKTSYTSN